MGMGIIIDLILLIIVILNAIIGYKKGLIKVAFNIFAFLIALITTLILVKPVSHLIIKNTTIDENIKNIIINNNELKNDDQIIENTDEDNQQKNNIFIQKYIEKVITEKTNEAKNKAVEIVADNISMKAVELFVAIALYIIIRIIIMFLSFLSDTISQIPLIKQFNEFGGIIYGLLKSAVIIYLILTIIFIICSIKGNLFISDAIEESYITKFLYNNNIIVKYCLLNKNLL